MKYLNSKYPNSKPQILIIIIAFALALLLIVFASLYLQRKYLPPENQAEQKKTEEQPQTAPPNYSADEAKGKENSTQQDLNQAQKSVTDTPTDKEISSESTALDCLHYDEKAFAVNLAQAKAYPRQGKIIAATLPHYPPVMNLTASVLATVQDYPYQKIIVLGPNHTAQGPALIIGAQGWKTPLGKINGCFSQGRELLNKKDLAPIGIFDQRMTEDHSIAVQMPYIKHYFPQTPVLSILISRAATLGQLQSLAETIYRWQEKEDILVLASIDFSHDQDYQKALDNDQKTKYAVEKKDINSLNLLKGDFLDSPQSLITLICLGQYYNQNLQLWQEFIQRGLPPLSQQGYTYLIYNLQDK